MLEVSNLTLQLDGKIVLKDISFKIPIQGEIIGIIGPNGAGKSSLIKSLIGEFQASGKQTLFNKPIQHQLKSMTYIPQKANIDIDFPISVEQVILSGCYKETGWFTKIPKSARQHLVEVMDDLELTPLRHKQISQLSGGQLQRVLVARALMSESRIYFLDEPFVGIDFRSEDTIMQKLAALKRSGKLIFIVYHDLSKTEAYFDRVLLLNKTLRYLGPTKSVVNSELIYETFLGK
ncbi:metal ABC transporter ATP-binding protein [Staphylococcus lugdunensis]|uniref:metal ABC transporter ATP-binding protein n=1 Tax=Staphylococcus TaxID=1279 RepID=UPI0008A27DD5|nr:MULTISPECIES: metal ABC transporter ATP-binding protein [Staphylococcus]MCH8665762.1 metal ABC transporter ATP-binding protein [Staphylococcus lugdunensis]OFJ65134.1 phosphonate ABC transporter ATP-binding protein [Staphylococcus sp. HMSC077E11]OFM42206.1 phosphonate ABC transporter ATP-binding protein [Staphylococcus sp. HMSC077E12]OFR91127.1 phosphonate ABC transporter ATP-binding protein [Staphylococcus sp. HMSC059F04]OHQ48751.1 phosphonate ABC transporter ATP-binding protein [Staphyloco